MMNPEMPSFNSRTDYLFNGKKGNNVEINNTADGYRVLMTMDEAYKAIIVFKMEIMGNKNG